MDPRISFETINGISHIRVAVFVADLGEMLGLYLVPYGGSLPPSQPFLEKLKAESLASAKREIERRAWFDREIHFTELMYVVAVANSRIEKRVDPSLLLKQFQLDLDLSHLRITPQDIAGSQIRCSTNFKPREQRGSFLRLQWEVDMYHPTETTLITDAMLPASPDIFGRSRSGLFGKLKLRFDGEFLDKMVIQIVKEPLMQPITVEDYLRYVRYSLLNQSAMNEALSNEVRLHEKGCFSFPSSR